MSKNYQTGLLHLVQLVISADGVIDKREEEAFEKIRKAEKISDEVYNEFIQEVRLKKERDIYMDGIGLINSCEDDEKVMAFVHLYKLSESDVKVHVKEIRLLLYSVKLSGVEFNDVVEKARHLNY
jgi:uncharacterized tellurite resistance protein B-like protein